MAWLLVGRIVLGTFLLPSALAKFADLSRVVQDVAAYEILPPWAARQGAAILPSIELAIALALILGVALPVAGVLATVLFAAFTVAVAINLRRGRRIRCGCYGIAGTATISWGIVARGGLLFVIAVGATVLSSFLVAGNRWLIPWSTDGRIANSLSAIALLGALVVCAIVIIYIVEWAVDAEGGLSELRKRMTTYQSERFGDRGDDLSFSSNGRR